MTKNQYTILAIILLIFGIGVVWYLGYYINEGDNIKIPTRNTEQSKWNNKSTLKGTDSNQDGVRDDVEKYIYSTYPNNLDVQNGLLQYARGVQKAILNAESEQVALSSEKEITLARECLVGIMGLDPAHESYSNLLVKILDTEERNMAYIAFDKQLSGHYFPGTINEDWRQSCNF